MPENLRLGIKKYAIRSAQVEKFAATASNKSLLLGGGPPIRLPFIMEKQVQTQWCWAATATSISRYYDSLSHWTQCLVGESALSLNCCFSPGPCNESWFLDRALTITGNFVTYKGPISFSAVETELLAGKVIGCRVGWRGGGGHFVAIYGCKTIGSLNYFSIDDPIYGKTEISEAGFSSAYQGSGTWTHTYITKA